MDEQSGTVYCGRRVVLDTAATMIYIGTLERVVASGYWLNDADVHDRSDGHASKEEYINQAAQLERQGTRRVNRRRVFVERGAVVSLSALEDVVAQDDDLAGEVRP